MLFLLGAMLVLARPAAAGDGGCGNYVCAGSPLQSGAGQAVSVLLDKCDRDLNDCFWPVRRAIDADVCAPPPYVVDGYLRNDGIKAALDWLRAHPEWNDKPSSGALKAAVSAMWPCR
jgi:hypothetical protein